MFDTVLVADRGVMACRVVRTCQRLGARAVTVHSEADARRLHARCADESLLLGPDDPGSSYLDGLKVIEAAGQAGAQAVHPGAGPLARSAAFASAVQDAGLSWIGPPPAALAAVERAAPGVDADLAVTLLAAPSGHVSVLADTARSAGRAASPSDLPGDARDRVRAAAVGAAGDAGLVGLGTVTVTREAQVTGLEAWLASDHPVVELVTGLDLVEQQLLLALGQDDASGSPGTAAAAAQLTLRAASSGRLRRLVLPEGPGLRVEAGCRKGDDLSPADGVLVVLAAAGATGAEADQRLSAARAQLVADGIDLEESP